jgi:hypothetical protein
VALTGPAPLSKDASVSNEHLQEIAREAHVNSLFDGRSDSDSECVQRSVVLAPGNTKDQQNEQPKAGHSSGTSSFCPLDLIDEDSDHNQNNSTHPDTSTHTHTRTNRTPQIHTQHSHAHAITRETPRGFAAGVPKKPGTPGFTRRGSYINYLSAIS